jgi:hypothetical protein
VEISCFCLKRTSTLSRINNFDLNFKTHLIYSYCQFAETVLNKIGINSVHAAFYFRQHSFMRLDGSSKIHERRDMVADFQNRQVANYELALPCVKQTVNRARICKRFRSIGIDSKETILPAHVAWRAGTTNRVVVMARQAGNRFLGS